MFLSLFVVQGSGFVMFPVQTVTTVDSKVVQLGYQDSRLLVSSLSRCYLCDTEKWVGLWWLRLGLNNLFHYWWRFLQSRLMQRATGLTHTVQYFLNAYGIFFFHHLIVCGVFFQASHFYILSPGRSFGAWGTRSVMGSMELVFSLRTRDWWRANPRCSTAPGRGPGYGKPVLMVMS